MNKFLCWLYLLQIMFWNTHHTTLTLKYAFRVCFTINVFFTFKLILFIRKLDKIDVSEIMLTWANILFLSLSSNNYLFCHFQGIWVHDSFYSNKSITLWHLLLLFLLVILMFSITPHWLLSFCCCYQQCKRRHLSLK